MNKPVLCSEIECTGCEACKNACPKDCIAMVSDSEGFLHPVIDYDKCIGCGKCEASCPVFNKPALDRSAEPEIYACWHNNDEVRMKSSSGGAFSVLAEMILEQGGVVFGAAYDDNLYVSHIGIECLDDLDKLRRSKYVQSEIGDSFCEVKQYLEYGRKVLFVATPCQISGLYAFLGKDNDNLLTADFICHGVPSPLVFGVYVDWIKKKYSCNLKDLNFRDKRKGWQNPITSICLWDGNQYSLKGLKNSFYNGFINGVFQRESCFNCKYRVLPRTASITIADYSMIKRGDYISQSEIDKGISLLMINDLRIKSQVVSGIKKHAVLYERNFDKISAGEKVMFKSSIKVLSRKQFFCDLKLLSYEATARKHLQYPLKKRVTQYAKEYLGPTVLLKLRKIKQYIDS